MWAMLAAPLMAGNDLRSMREETAEILTNKEVIAVNQDPLGNQAIRFLDMGDHEIWVKLLEDKEVAICFMNRRDVPWELEYDWQRINIYHKGAIRFSEQNYSMRDLWAHEEIGFTGNPLVHVIPAHGVLLLRLTPVKE